MREHLLGLRVAPRGLLALGDKQVAMALGVPGNHLGELLHLSQDGLARAAGVLRAPRVGHLDAELVHLPHELGRGGHAVDEALGADERDGLRERAHGVAQEHPVDGKMNVGLDAGRVGENLLDIQRLLEQRQQRRRRLRVHRQTVEVVDELCHVVLGKHLFEALDRTLGSGADAVDLHRAGEPREEGAVGQPHRQLAHGESGDGQQDRVAQSLARDLRAKDPPALAVLLGAGAQMAPHEGVLQAGLRQNPIHLDERVAEVAVVFCAKNARKCWTEIGLKWYGIHVFYLSLSL